MPLYDWECMAHGKFEAFVGKCPHGCSKGMVKRLPVLSLNISTSGKTKFIDNTMKQMSKEFGITDFNNRGGQAVTEEAARWESQSSIEKKRILGQTYSMPVDPKAGVSSVTGAVGASTDSNIVSTMRQEGRVSFRPNVVADDHQRIKPEDLK